ncbi:MAG TPA: hypothetical protein VI895_15065 [Bdellovibrionota bacterium]|nr:hypothetical protein [Bdellovibrionota bacterium]
MRGFAGKILDGRSLFNSVHRRRHDTAIKKLPGGVHGRCGKAALETGKFARQEFVYAG